MDSLFFQANEFFICHVLVCYTTKVVPTRMYVCILNCQVPGVIVDDVSEKASDSTKSKPNIEPIHVYSYCMLNMYVYMLNSDYMVEHFLHNKLAIDI